MSGTSGNRFTSERRKHQRSGVSLNIRAGWIASAAAAMLAVATAVECHQYSSAAFPHSSWVPSAIYGVVLWLWWAAIGVPIWMVGRRWPKFWLISIENGVLQLCFAGAVAVAHLKILQIAMHWMIVRWSYLKALGYEQVVSFSIQRLSLEVLLYMILWATCAAVCVQVVRQREALQLAELKQQLSSAHLRALQMQMKPHFLFNTLNAITTLVELGRQKEAIKTLSHLNAILRSTLAQQVPDKVSMAQELAVVDNYLAIEQIRFADRLRVEMRVDPDALDGLVPCFLLQPIVENAIQHGISQLEDLGIVTTSIERSGHLLHISVKDNGPGLRAKSHHRGHGVGLRSTEDRLAYFYPQRYEFSSGELKSGGFVVSITIPYERSHEIENSHRGR